MTTKTIPEQPGTYLTLDQTAALLQVSRRSCQNFIARGLLRASKVGGKLVRVRREDISKFMDRGATIASE
jgi:excisionase family DNA binding protein